jgi:TatD DNase family protein
MTTTASFTDSHCHLEAADFRREDGSDERDEVVARALAAGVGQMICVGSGGSLAEVDNAIAFAERYPSIWAAVGIHPHDAKNVTDEILARIEALAAGHPRVVAVGETGLDYHYDHSPRDRQAEVLRAFVAIARRTGKPVSLHLRGKEPRSLGDAHADAQRILSEERIHEIGGVVHCFTGTKDDAVRYVELGLHISLSGVVTFKSASAIREAAAWIPDDRLLVETDCPYMAPVPFRGKRNEPAYVVHTARFVADLRGVPVERLAQVTTDNAKRLFRLRS